MKKMLLTVMLTIVSLTWVSCESRVIMENELPQQARAYVTQHFADYTVGQVMKDWDDGKVEYEVILSATGNVFFLEFDRKGQIKTVDSQTNTALPESVVPAKILEYQKKTFPSNFIVEWTVQKKVQTVDMDNDLELVFSLAGDFLRIDD